MGGVREHKAAALRAQGTLNPCPERVRDELFEGGDFFDRRDLLQVKYEMVRRVRTDRMPAAQVAALFGVSRPTLYKAMADFDTDGMVGLRPRLRGPKGGHKLTSEAVAFIQKERATNPAARISELTVCLAKAKGITVHPRSIERALARLKKKGLGRGGRKGRQERSADRTL